MIKHRWPRKIIRNPRPIRRHPRDFDRRRKFPSLYDLEIKPKEEYPGLYTELQELKDKFVKIGRKTELHCMRSRDKHISAIEVCICRCKKKCQQLTLRNLVAKGESPKDFLDDFIKLQRLVNIIYGTVRQKDVNPK